MLKATLTLYGREMKVLIPLDSIPMKLVDFEDVEFVRRKMHDIVTGTTNHIKQEYSDNATVSIPNVKLNGARPYRLGDITLDRTTRWNPVELALEVDWMDQDA